jgi:predicted RNA binding protein YcfA (HicA-like mRNA interferase family)
MIKLPIISGKECVRALEKIGFYVAHQKGSHINLRRENPFAKTVVPNHKELKKGTLKAILKDANLTVDEFIALL